MKLEEKIMKLISQYSDEIERLEEDIERHKGSIGVPAMLCVYYRVMCNLKTALDGIEGGNPE